MTRRVGIIAMLSVATLLWFVAILGIWAQRQALNTHNWTTTSERLLRDDKIRVALSGLLLDRLYQSAPIETRVREELPPQLQPLTAPLAAGLRSAATQVAPRILGSPPALTAWKAANQNAHKALLKLLDGSGADVNLDLKGLLQQVATRVGLPADAVDRLPPNLQQLTVFHSDDLKTARSAVDLLRVLPWILTPLALLLMAGSIYLSPDRRRTILSAGGCIFLAGFAVLALRRVGGHVIVDTLAKTANGRDAAENVWAIGTSLLVDAARGSVLFGGFVMLGAWLAGVGRHATSVRRSMAPAFREHSGAVRVGVGVALLLLIMWDPVAWTHRFVPILIFTILAFGWLEWIRRRTLEQFPDAASTTAPVGTGEPAEAEPQEPALLTPGA